jgi:hypothetical protein
MRFYSVSIINLTAIELKRKRSSVIHINKQCRFARAAANADDNDLLVNAYYR